MYEDDEPKPATLYGQEIKAIQDAAEDFADIRLEVGGHAIIFRSNDPNYDKLGDCIKTLSRELDLYPE